MNDNVDENKLEDTVTLSKVEPETVVPDVSDTQAPRVVNNETKSSGLNTIKIIAIFIMVVSMGISIFYMFFYNSKKEAPVETPASEVVENDTKEEETVVEEDNSTEETETEEENETLAE